MRDLRKLMTQLRESNKENNSKLFSMIREGIKLSLWLRVIDLIMIKEKAQLNQRQAAQYQ